MTFLTSDGCLLSYYRQGAGIATAMGDEVIPYIHDILSANFTSTGTISSSICKTNSTSAVLPECQ